MTVEQIKVIYGASKSTIDKVRSGNTKGLSKDTINQITFLLNLDVDFVKGLFLRAEFADMVSLVLSKCQKKHHKSSADIIRLADKCLRRHNTLRKEFVVKHITDDDFTRGELLGIYMADASTLIKDEYFRPMCDVALELSAKDQDLRSFVAFIYDMSGLFLKLDKKKGVADAMPKM